MRRLSQSAFDLSYAAYVWVLAGFFAPITWIGVALLPKRTWRRISVRKLVRLVLRLAGITVIVRGLEHLPPNPPYVLVANHAGYMERLGVEFVERHEPDYLV